MTRPCLWCGQPLEGNNPRRRYCSDAHRAQARRNGPRAVRLADHQPRGTDGDITQAVLASLRTLGVPADDHLARAALALARALDAPQTTPSAMPGLSKELQNVLAYL